MFLYMDTPAVPMHIAFTVICNPPTRGEPALFQRVAELLDYRTHEVAPFRRRLVEVPLGLQHPVWVDDPKFDVSAHMHHHSLGSSADLRELGHYIGSIINLPLERDRPLWDCWIVEGLEHGRFAFVLKMHHAMVDGLAATSLVRTFLDATPIDEAPVPPNRTTGEVVPNKLQLLAQALGSREGRTRQLLDLMNQTGHTLDAYRKRFGDLGPHPLMAPKTHFNRSIGPNRDVGFARLSLSEVKQIKAANGCTLNDVILAICGGAVKSYLKAHDDLPEEPLIASIPVSIRNEATLKQSDNQVSTMRASLATHVDDPLDRLQLVREDTRDAKLRHDAMTASLIPDWSEFSSQAIMHSALSLFSWSGLTDRVGSPYNLVISNVPGPRDPLYFAGAEVEGFYPLGPLLEGVGLNITLASYCDQIDLTILVDSDLVSDVGEIAKYVLPAFEEIRDASLLTT